MPCLEHERVDVDDYLADPRSARWTGFREHYATCPDCSRAVAAWTRFENLVRAAAADPLSHPAADSLATFQGEPQQLSPAERRAIALHLRHCTGCRDALKGVTLLSNLLAAPEWDQPKN